MCPVIPLRLYPWLYWMCVDGGPPVCVCVGRGGTSCEHPLSRHLLPCCWRGKPSAPSRCAHRLSELPQLIVPQTSTYHPLPLIFLTISCAQCLSLHTLYTKAPSHNAGTLHIHQRLHQGHQLCSGLFERCNCWAPVGVKRSSQLGGAVRKKSKF